MTKTSLVKLYGQYGDDVVDHCEYCGTELYLYDEMIVANVFGETFCESSPTLGSAPYGEHIGEAQVRAS